MKELYTLKSLGHTWGGGICRWLKYSWVGESDNGGQKDMLRRTTQGHVGNLHPKLQDIIQSMQIFAFLGDLFSSSSMKQWTGWEENWKKGVIRLLLAAMQSGKNDGLRAGVGTPWEGTQTWAALWRWDELYLVTEVECIWQKWWQGKGRGFQGGEGNKKWLKLELGGRIGGSRINLLGHLRDGPPGKKLLTFCLTPHRSTWQPKQRTVTQKCEVSS